MGTRDQYDTWLRARIGNVLERYDEQMEQATRAFETNIADARKNIKQEIDMVMKHYEGVLQSEGVIEYREYLKGQAVITYLDGGRQEITEDSIALPIKLEDWTEPAPTNASLTFHAPGGSVKLSKPLENYNLYYWENGTLRIIDPAEEKQWTLENVETLTFDELNYKWFDNTLTVVQ